MADVEMSLVKENNFGEGNSDTTLHLENFCTEGLRIPLDHLDHWSRPLDYDAYRIHTVNGLEFVISGPQLHQWQKHSAEFGFE